MDGETGGEHDRDLVGRIRRGDPAAYQALVARYAPLLVTYGRRMGLRAGEGRELALDVLADVAAELASARRGARVDLACLAGERFRERLFADKSERQRRLACARDAQAWVDRERPVGAIPGTCSEGSARAARGADWEPAPSHPVQDRLAVWLDERMDDAERDLLAWVSEHLPQRRMAEWLGVSHAAARKRLSRLRERLARETDAFLERLPDGERRELERVLGRRAAVRAVAERGRRAARVEGTLGATDE